MSPALLARAGLYTVGMMGSIAFVGATAKQEKYLYLGGPLLAGVAIVGITREHRVLLAQPVIESRAQGLALVRAEIGSRERSKTRYVRLEHDRRKLILMLIIEEEKQLVLLDRPTDPEARIAAREKWIRSQWVSLQARVSSHVVIAIVEERGSVKLIAATAANSADSAGPAHC